MFIFLYFDISFNVPVDKSVALAELMRRPEISYDKLAAVDETRPSLLNKRQTML